ncbi:MAG TPA: UvrD-helicase domain-containing protein [Verrucomicrobiae bacterium]|nr:UvrD-helicase domain-containing protein [Verrucomicrobiae bacterium]
MTTPQQQAAIAARGNVLVAAGAGTGKTSTVTERCLDLIIRERCSVGEILMVTFTEAAAAEMRERIRHALHQAAASPPDPETALWLAEQNALLDTAPISTLHGFCLELVRRNFHVLGLDPQFTVLDEQQTKPLIHSVLDALFQKHYADASDHARAVAEFVRGYGNGRDEAIRQLVLKIHEHAQTLAAPAQWLAEQCALFNNPSADTWRTRFLEAVLDWASYWRSSIEELAERSANLAACAEALQSLGQNSTFRDAAAALTKVTAANEREWEYGTKGKLRKPIESFFTSAAFLRDLMANDGAPLAEDWEWSRRPMLALLELAREFSDEFARAKRELGGIDFSDQEQFALRLLLDAGQPTAIARACRERFRYVFVDECQDINAAQDAILRAVSREGADANRFLVGDVKQSIYRFRLANPRIFQEYQERWSRGELAPAPSATNEPRELQFDFFAAPAPPTVTRGKRKPASPPPAPAPTVSARALSLTENFRSREALLQFINPVFRVLMRPVIGGLTYDAAAELQFGNRQERMPLTIAARRERPSEVEPQQWPDPGEVTPRVELHVLTRDNDADSGEEVFDSDPATNDVPDLPATEREALLVARRLKQLRASGHRVWRPREKAFAPVEYRDMVILMRSTNGRAEVFARTFHHEGIPLHASRAGFLEAQEVQDVLNLLRLLDNPLQDFPLLAVLRSPLVGLSPEELVQLRLAGPNDLLWTALLKLQARQPAEGVVLKARTFVSAFHRWRELIRHTSLTKCIESALTETYYEALLLAGERGPERVANLHRLIELARRFDPFQRAGLFRFLQFIAEQEETEARHEPAELFNENAVRLMTIHASKGLEFPVVVLAGLGTRFNVRDLGNDILLHEDLGLCPKVLPPETRTRYPSIVHWLAAQRERRALLGEELRLLYVAMTRARDTLILTGATSRKDEVTRWEEPSPINDHALAKATCFLDWLRLWFTNEGQPLEWQNDFEGANELLRWRFYLVNDPAFAPEPTATNNVAPGLQLPSSEALAEIRSRIGYQYAHLAATREAAKSSVTALRRRATEADDEARPLFPFTRPALTAPRVATDKLSAAEIGTAHHAFLQFVDLAQVGSEATLRNEAARLRDAGGLSEDEFAALDFAALAAFWNSEVGQQIRAVPHHYINREMPFTARFDASELEQLVGGFVHHNDPADFVIVQGALDLAVLLPEEIWLLDFKTDQANAAELPAKVEHYKPQLKIYAAALTRIYRRRVTRCWLHFLAAKKTVSIAPLA